MSAHPLADPCEAALLRAQYEGVAAWREELKRLLSQKSLRELSGEERERLSGWLRTRAAVDACLARQSRVRALPGDPGTRAVVVHRAPASREALEQQLAGHGMRLIGRGRDAAVAVALAVVEQPDLLVVEDGLPGVVPLELAGAVRRFAPRTVVVVQANAESDVPALEGAGASLVVAPPAGPAEVAAQCAAALEVLEVLEVSGVSPALRGGAVAG